MPPFSVKFDIDDVLAQDVRTFVDSKGATAKVSTVPGGATKAQPSASSNQGDGYELDMSVSKIAENGAVMHQVVATRKRETSRGVFRKGDRGGWVVSTSNLIGDAWLDATAEINDSRVVVSDNAFVSASVLTGQTWIAGNTGVFSSFISDSKISGQATVISAWVEENCEITNEASVENTTMRNKSRVHGNANVNDSELSDGVLVHSATVNKSLVLSNARITGSAEVDNSTVSGSSVTVAAKVLAGSVVEKRASISGNATVKNTVVSDASYVVGNGHVSDSTLLKQSRVLNYARAHNTTLTNVLLKGQAAVAGSPLSNCELG